MGSSEMFKSIPVDLEFTRSQLAQFCGTKSIDIPDNFVRTAECYNSQLNMSGTIQETARIAPDVRARYEAVIGLEVHAQLETRTKAFCPC